MIALAAFFVSASVAFGVVMASKGAGRWLSVLERRMTLDENAVQAKARLAVPPSIPPDLLRRITRWADDSAQEAERSVILTLYENFRDAADPWSSVRQSLPPEPRDDGRTIDAPFLQ